MKTVFEDKLAEIQERIVSTCLEALEEKKVEKTFIYGFWSSSQMFFNVFFKKEKSILSYEDLGVSDDLIDQVFDLGMDDIIEIIELFKNDKKNPPNQYKMTFDNVTNSFDCNFEYDDLEKSKLVPMDIYFDWREQAKKI